MYSGLTLAASMTTNCLFDLHPSSWLCAGNQLIPQCGLLFLLLDYLVPLLLVLQSPNSRFLLIFCVPFYLFHGDVSKATSHVTRLSCFSCCLSYFRIFLVVILTSPHLQSQEYSLVLSSWDFLFIVLFISLSSGFRMFSTQWGGLGCVQFS